jgi:hypothetical protein
MNTLKPFAVPALLVVCASVWADPLDQWTWRNPLPQGNSLLGIAYGKNQFVAVGAGTILTSPDGATWTTRVNPPGNDLTCVAYGNDLFVAVGADFSAGIGPNSISGCTILTSPDGITWTSRTSGTPNGLTGIAYGNHQFVAVGPGEPEATILTSPDGINWTKRTCPTIYW